MTPPLPLHAADYAAGLIALAGIALIVGIIAEAFLTYWGDRP